MPNTFIDNREAWLRMSEIDYLGQFVKVWLAFNAWYRSAYSETQDRKIINELKRNSSPVGNALRPLIETQSEDAEQFRSDIGFLHHRLEHYEINTGKDEAKQRITFRRVYLKDRPPCIEQVTSYGFTFKVERKQNGAIESSVVNKSRSSIFLYPQTKHDLLDLTAQQGFSVLRPNQQNCLRNLYEQIAPKEVADLLSTTRTSAAIKCGSYSFYCSREELFAAVIEAVYLMRCHLFHGELSPTRKASECYEPAYRIVRRFINCVS
ncbi:MAG: hypothetical protein V5B35_09660 [Candidatus Accumulibacter necessarius]|jgi:hypothetical protein